MNYLHVFGTSLLLSAMSTTSFAASCCGGGSSNSIALPKFNQGMLDVSQGVEIYNGKWTSNGDYQKDPSGSDLKQYSLNIAYAKRLSENWQSSVFVPVIHNETHYSGADSSSSAIGDAALSFWYETFDNVTCVYDIRGWQSLKPSIYLGSSLTLPTGKSAYSDGIDETYDTTGRGFYRFDANVMVEKTVYPWSVTLNWSTGYHFERPVNQEYNRDVEPYNKQLGMRHLFSAALGYTWFRKDMSMITLSGTYSDLSEGRTQVDGKGDAASGFQKVSNALNFSYSTPRRDWIFKLGYSQANEGKNYPKTSLINGGVSYVY